MAEHAEVDYEHLRFPYTVPPELAGDARTRHPVVVVGAGPVGLSAAIDLAQRGQPVLLLDDDDSLSTGSRAICFAKRTLEIFDRYGCGERVVDKGVSWQTGKVFLGDEMVYQFDLLPEEGHRRPAFVNLQQYYVEGFLAEKAMAMPLIDLRWRNKVTALQQTGDGVALTVQTPDGDYEIHADWLLACDGARSPIRHVMGLESKGRVFRDRFLIADIRMQKDFPTERRFWFNPPFHPQWSVLMHKQPDNVWRIDFQLGWDVDPERETDPERVRERVRSVLGDDVRFELVWVSIYTFSCKRMDKFRHDRVLFVGDSAHGVSPFGARGANGGVQDAENIAWKLARVLDGRSPESLLDTYDDERQYAADENILNSTRATDFITPKSEVSRQFRDAVLQLSRRAPFARRMVNSGRLSVPAVLKHSSLNTPDTAAFHCPAMLGGAALDAPIIDEDGLAAWLVAGLPASLCLLQTAGQYDDQAVFEGLEALRRLDTSAQVIVVLEPGQSKPGRSRDGVRWIVDAEGLIKTRYGLTAGCAYLFRPDQHICARWRAPSAHAIEVAAQRALGLAA